MTNNKERAKRTPLVIGKAVNITIRMEGALKERIRSHAKTLGLSPSTWLRMLAIANMENVDSDV